MSGKVNELAEKSTRLLEDLEKERIREIMRDAYSCASKCSSNIQASRVDVDRCVGQCFQPFENAQNVISNEMNSFQNRLQRCAQSCEDNIKDKFDYNSSGSQMTLVQNQMEDCISKCCDDHVEVLHKTLDRIKAAINEIRPPSAFL